MTRYRQALLNEVEFEVDGNKVLIRPSLKQKFEALEMLKDFQQKKDADLKKLKNFLVDLIFESLPEQERSEVSAKIEVETFVVENILKLWAEVQVALKFAKREDVDRLLKGDSEAEKK